MSFQYDSFAGDPGTFGLGKTKTRTNGSAAHHPETDTHEALVETPVDDYELIDFGHGRKLERWGEYLIETS